MSKGDAVNYFLLFRPLTALVLNGMLGLFAVLFIIEVAKRESRRLIARFKKKNSAAMLHEFTPT